jgi:hypothetical protein
MASRKDMRRAELGMFLSIPCGGLPRLHSRSSTPEAENMANVFLPIRFAAIPYVDPPKDKNESGDMSSMQNSSQSRTFLRLSWSNGLTPRHHVEHTTNGCCKLDNTYEAILFRGRAY